MTRFIDSHAHLDAKNISGDLDTIVARAREVGLTDIICVGASDGFESNPATVAAAERYDELYASVGIHPHDAKMVTDDVMTELAQLAEHPKVVAIGETGLDYHYDLSPRSAQRDAFVRSLTMARAKDMPVIVHTREAEADTIQILRDHDSHEIPGVIHCFTGTEKLAEQALDLGFYISFSGVLTFRNADALRAIAKDLPKDRVLVETDCPYLSPVPRRGQANEPAFIIHTTAVLADLWGQDLDPVMKQTGDNAARLFRI